MEDNMVTCIEFTMSDGKKHPETDQLSKNPLANLILDCVRENEDVFGAINHVTVYFAPDGVNAELHVAPDSLARWQPVTRIPVTAGMFKATALPDRSAAVVRAFFGKFGRTTKET
jgi:hypothetical protein